MSIIGRISYWKELTESYYFDRIQKLKEQDQKFFGNSLLFHSLGLDENKFLEILRLAQLNPDFASQINYMDFRNNPINLSEIHLEPFENLQEFKIDWLGRKCPPVIVCYIAANADVKITAPVGVKIELKTVDVTAKTAEVVFSYDGWELVEKVTPNGDSNLRQRTGSSSSSQKDHSGYTKCVIS